MVMNKQSDFTDDPKQRWKIIGQIVNSKSAKDCLKRAQFLIDLKKAEKTLQ